MTASSLGSEGAKSTSAKRPAAAGRRKSRSGAPRLVGYLFVAPFVLVFIAMLVVPIFYALYLSLFQTRLIGGESFAGLANYARAFADPKLHEGLFRVLQFLIIQVPIMLVVALAFALAIDSGKVRGAPAVRLMIFVPYAIPGVVGVLIWGYLYGTKFGLVTQTAQLLGLPAPELLSASNMLGSMMNIVTWHYAGYNMIVLYSALRAVPPELYESAVMDGASAWRIAWNIKIPAILPAIQLCAVFSAIGAFQVFTEPNLMQPLAPTIINTWYTPSYYAYNMAFLEHNASYSATLAFVLGLAIAVLAYVVQLMSAREKKK